MQRGGMLIFCDTLTHTMLEWVLSAIETPALHILQKKKACANTDVTLTAQAHTEVTNYEKSPLVNCFQRERRKI